MNLRTLARADTPTGEGALRERAAPAGPVHELIVNGAFAMDSVDSSSEVALAVKPCATGSASAVPRAWRSSSRPNRSSTGPGGG